MVTSAWVGQMGTKGNKKLHPVPDPSPAIDELQNITHKTCHRSYNKNSVFYCTYVDFAVEVLKDKKHRIIKNRNKSQMFTRNKKSL